MWVSSNGFLHGRLPPHVDVPHLVDKACVCVCLCACVRFRLLTARPAAREGVHLALSRCSLLSFPRLARSGCAAAPPPSAVAEFRTCRVPVRQLLVTQRAWCSLSEQEREMGGVGWGEHRLQLRFYHLVSQLLFAAHIWAAGMTRCDCAISSLSSFSLLCRRMVESSSPHSTSSRMSGHADRVIRAAPACTHRDACQELCSLRPLSAATRALIHRLLSYPCHTHTHTHMHLVRVSESAASFFLFVLAMNATSPSPHPLLRCHGECERLAGHVPCQGRRRLADRRGRTGRMRRHHA